MIEHALWLASNGFAVFPLEPRGKRPLTRHGCKDASRDPAQIQAWWLASGEANIGIATGRASPGPSEGSIVVLDIDGAEGEAALSALGLLPETLEARTGKGRHLYFAYPSSGVSITIGQSKIGQNIDHRGDGGYVVAPPSIHPSGARYEWVRVVAPAPLPASIAAALENKRQHIPPSVCVLSPTAPGIPSSVSVSSVGLDPAPLADVDSAPLAPSLSLEGHLQALSTAPPGTKHAAVVSASWAHACAAHETGEGRLVAEPRVLNAISAALALNVLSRVENWDGVIKAVSSAFDRAYARPAPVVLSSFEREFNDDGLARRFAKFYGPFATGAGAAPSCCFVPGQGWRVWDGMRWAEQPGNGRPTELVSKMLIELQAEVMSGGDQKLADSVRAKRTAGTMGSILTLAQRYLSIGFHAFDADPLLLNARNGTIDLRSGLLRAHFPGDLLTKCCNVAYGPGSPANWAQALRTMQHGDESAVEYMHVLLGSFVQGSPVDGFWLMHGNGFDGKSTVLDVLHAVLGSYAMAVNPQTILVSRNGAKPHTSMMGGLAGARLGTIDEMPSDCQLDTGAIKSYFGRLPVRMQTGMGKDFVDVTPTAKGLAASNHLPRVDENDFGTQRRIAVIPFPGLRALGVCRDDSFALRLVEAEGPAILAWLVAGCGRWLASGRALPECERVRLATEELFGEGDIVGTFLGTCMYGSHASCTAGELYGAYKAYAESQGDFVCSKRAFGNRCREHNVIPYKGAKGERMYVGIRPHTGNAPLSAPTK